MTSLAVSTPWSTPWSTPSRIRSPKRSRRRLPGRTLDSGGYLAAESHLPGRGTAGGEPHRGGEPAGVGFKHHSARRGPPPDGVHPRAIPARMDAVDHHHRHHRLQHAVDHHADSEVHVRPRARTPARVALAVSRLPTSSRRASSRPIQQRRSRCADPSNSSPVLPAPDAPGARRGVGTTPCSSPSTRD